MIPSATAPAPEKLFGEFFQVLAIQSAAALTLAALLSSARAGSVVMVVTARNMASRAVRNLRVSVTMYLLKRMGRECRSRNPWAIIRDSEMN